MARTTSKISSKLYKCAHCGEEHFVATNHYGSIYSRCPNFRCVSRRPVINATYKPPKHDCLEPLPEGMDRPEDWKVVTIEVAAQPSNS